MQTQRALIKAKLIIDAADIESAEQFINHLSNKSHIMVTDRGDVALPTEEGDRHGVHLWVERRPCWGNWSSDIRRDVLHSLKRTSSQVTCNIVDVSRTVIETRAKAVAPKPTHEALNASPAPATDDTKPTAVIVASPEREFGLVDTLMAAQDDEANLIEQRCEHDETWTTEELEVEGSLTEEQEVDGSLKPEEAVLSEEQEMDGSLKPEEAVL